VKAPQNGAFSVYRMQLFNLLFIHLGMTNIRQAFSFLLFGVLLFADFVVCGQSLSLLPLTDGQSAKIEQIRNDPKINADAAFKLLNQLNDYPDLKAVGKDYKWFYNDATFGKVPMRVYIPANYRHDKKSPCILMLHGAAGQNTFSDIDSLNKGDDLYDVFKSLTNEGYIIIRPIADGSKNFDWVVNKFGNQSNLTYQTLNAMLISLKHVLNIDDSRVFAFGHSDGSDGATGLGVYNPDPYAGIVAYNSMLTNIFAHDFYIRNMANRSLYAVHSDLDDLRPMLQTREIINALKKDGGAILYEEYLGYTHQDKHLDLDRPRVVDFMRQTERNAFQKKIEWETNSLTYNTCDWLTITKLNTDAQPVAWYQPFNIQSYDKRAKTFLDRPYYGGILPAAAVKATYANNVFNIQTSRVVWLEVKISPQMVDMSKPVVVNLNGKEVYKGFATADKQYLLNNFKTTFDRQALWVNAIKLPVN